MKYATDISTVAGKAEPTPRGAIATPKTTPPTQASLVHVPF